jgi:DNA polymerase-1
MASSPLILVDGSSYFFRAFHALPPLTNSKGQPTGAIYGVANMVKRLIKDYQPEKIAVIFDAKGKTFRDDLYPQYKANRPPMPDELSSQFQPLYDLLSAMGLPLIMEPGVEADDVIGTLASQAKSKGINVVISTGDKDIAQLVNHQVTLINTMTDKMLDEAGVIEKFGVKANQMIDYLTLVGDNVDNIPGVPKCGPKTAAKWLGEYESLDNLIAHADEIGGKIGEYLRESIPKLPLSKQLVTIKCDVNLPFDIDDLTPGQADEAKLIEMLKEFEFKTWLKSMLEQQADNASEETISQNANYHIIHDKTAFDSLLTRLQHANLFSFDTETTDLAAINAELVGMSFAIQTGEAFYIPLAHIDYQPQLNRDDVLAALKPILEDKTIKKVGQNLKYDYNVMKNYDITLQGIAYDTMLESYIIDSSASRHDMDSLSLKYLGHKTISFEDIAGKGVKQLRFDQISVDKAAPYAAEDADITLQLHQVLSAKLDDKLKSVLLDIEMPLLTVLAEMERKGVSIDLDVLEKQGHRLKKQIEALEVEAVELAGHPFNLNSPKQLQEILFDELKLPIISKTPKGQASTAESVLQELGHEYRLPAVILAYRSLSKLVSTYIDALPKRVNPKTHRVHTSYNQAVTATGRLSSSEPNLQNIPVRSEEGRAIRQAFIAPPGKLLVAADYSQIELRIMAHLSKDESLLNAFKQGWDIHAATASEIFHIPLDQVTSDHRRKAKAVNFGLIYGMSSFGLARQIDVDRQEAQHYIETYFKRYPGVKRYMDETRAKAHDLGYVETIFGRRLYLPEINSRNGMRRKAAERTAINAPMQGTAADIIKKAMLSIANWQQTQSPSYASMIMQVHDELVFEVSIDSLEKANKEIRQHMEHTVELSVPLVVSIGSGQNWDEAH